MQTFLTILINSKDIIYSWNDSIWRIMIESAIIHTASSITFKFINGKEIEIQ